ncbi:hypothetical protein QOT17_000173 [Balamuthia mandrillaris]
MLNTLSATSSSYKLFLSSLFLLSFFLLSLRLTSAQYCEPFNGVPPECIPVLTFPIYIPEGTTQEQLAEGASVAIEQTKLIPPAFSSCVPYARTLACLEAFAGCNNYTEAEILATDPEITSIPASAELVDGENHPFGIRMPTCKPACTVYSQFCGSVFPEDCEQTVSNGVVEGGEPQEVFKWPEDTSIVQDYNVSIPGTSLRAILSTPCVVAEGVADGNVVCTDCPPHYCCTDGGGCSPCCPFAMFSDEEYDGVAWMFTSLALLGCGMSIIFLVPYIVTRDKRKWQLPVVLPFWAVLCSFGTALAGFLPVFWGGWREVLCSSDTEYSTQSDNGCGAIGALTYMSAYFGLAWWTVINFNLIRIVFFPPSLQQNNTWWHLGYHLVVWIPGLAFAITILANRKFRATPGAVNCFLDVQSDEGWWFDGFFNLPLGIFCIVSTLCIGAVIIKILMTSGWKGLKQQMRFLCFAVYYDFFLIYMLADRLRSREQQDEVEVATTEYFTCLAAPNAQDGYILDECDGSGACCDLDSPYTIGIFIMAHINNSLPFVMVPAIFGLSKTTYSWWKNWIVGLVHGKWNVDPTTTAEVSSLEGSGSKGKGRSNTGGDDKNERSDSSISRISEDITDSEDEAGAEMTNVKNTSVNTALSLFFLWFVCGEVLTTFSFYFSLQT